MEKGFFLRNKNTCVVCVCLRKKQNPVAVTPFTYKITCNVLVTLIIPCTSTPTFKVVIISDTLELFSTAVVCESSEKSHVN